MAIGDYGSRYGYWGSAYACDERAKSWSSRLTEQGFSVTTIGKLCFKGDTPGTGFPDQRTPLYIRDGIGDVYEEIHDRQIIRPQFCKVLERVRAGESDYTRYGREVTGRMTESLRTEGSISKSLFASVAGSVAPYFPLAVPQEYVGLCPNPETLLPPTQFNRRERPHHPAMDDYRRYCY